MEDQEIVNEFLIESTENLARLDQEMVELEQRPRDAQLLASIFRTIHTIKGTCGFLGFQTLEGVTHHAENLLSQVRNGERDLTPPCVSLILEAVDAIKGELVSIEQSGAESGETWDDLRRRLKAACEAGPDAAAEPARVPVPEPRASESEPPVAATAPPPAAAAPAPEAAASPTGADAPGAKSASVADSTIRVDVHLLDKLMNLVGELVLARNQVLQFNARQEDPQLNATSQRLNLITTQLQEGVMKTRMQPIGVLWNKLPRVVRDLAAACGKQIQLTMDGADTELDKSIIEAIKDPLTHIVRNCCDHGIEAAEVRVRAGKPPSGRLSLRAFHEGGQVNIEIADDGAGIDPARVKGKAVEKGLIRPEQAERMSDREAVQLVFLPGFSTAAKVTNISGRGVGMDVVKTNIEKIGGTVDLSSRFGQGATVRIKIPLTLAIIPGLVITCGSERFVIPQVSLVELLRLDGDAGKSAIERIHGTPVYRRRGALLPVAFLSEVLGLRTASGQTGERASNIVVLQVEDRQFGLVVDGISDTQEIVVKPLGKQLKGLSCYAGATIMGDGKVSLILDVHGIGHRSGVMTSGHQAGRPESTDGEPIVRETLLLFRAGSHGRLAAPLTMVARLEEFPKAKIERSGGRQVVQYRGQILPLVPMAPGVAEGNGKDTAAVVVFHAGNHHAGLVVDEIVDIVEDQVTARKPSGEPNLIGSAVVGGKVTDFIDLPQVLAGCGEAAESGPRLSVLVADPSPFCRAAVRGYLEMAGHRVWEASSVPESLDRLAATRCDAVLAAVELEGDGPGMSGAIELRQRILERFLTGAPQVIATASPKSDPRVLAAAEAFDKCQLKYDRESMLRSLERLGAAVGEPELAGAGAGARGGLR